MMESKESIEYTDSVAYTKSWGNGKVFHCSIGHYLKDFENENVVKLIIQGINWTTK